MSKKISFLKKIGSWAGTLEFMANPKAVKALEQGLKEAKAGKFHSFKKVFGQHQ